MLLETCVFKLIYYSFAILKIIFVGKIFSKYKTCFTFAVDCKSENAVLTHLRFLEGFTINSQVNFQVLFSVCPVKLLVTFLLEGAADTL